MDIYDLGNILAIIAALLTPVLLLLIEAPVAYIAFAPMVLWFTVIFMFWVGVGIREACKSGSQHQV